MYVIVKHIKTENKKKVPVILLNSQGEIWEFDTEKIAEEFDRKEQAGAKGYGPSVPAKLVRQFGSPSGPTLKQLSLLALNELVPAEDREKSSYKLLFTVISTLPESPTNTL